MASCVVIYGRNQLLQHQHVRLVTEMQVGMNSLSRMRTVRQRFDDHISVQMNLYRSCKQTIRGTLTFFACIQPYLRS